MATINAIDSNIPIEIAKGGTNATSMATTDGVVYFDGTRLVTSAAGTAAQVLTGNGSSAPTYQAAPGTMVLLNTQTGSASGSLAFTSTYITSTYNSYLIKLTNIVSSASSQLQMTFSTDNGSNYLATNYLSGANSIDGSTTSWSNVNSTTFCALSATATTWLGFTGYIYINIPASASVFYTGKLAEYKSGTSSSTVVVGVNTGTTTVNNIKFAFSSGNITSGTFSLYGIKQ